MPTTTRRRRTRRSEEQFPLDDYDVLAAGAAAEITEDERQRERDTPGTSQLRARELRWQATLDEYGKWVFDPQGRHLSAAPGGGRRKSHRRKSHRNN